jgi:hypothetical protein
VSTLHREIRWFRTEIAQCELAISEIDSDRFFGSSKEQALASLRGTLVAHQQTLAGLEQQLAALSRRCA